jgi:hypothetical protein
MATSAVLGIGESFSQDDMVYFLEPVVLELFRNHVRAEQICVWANGKPGALSETSLIGIRKAWYDVRGPFTSEGEHEYYKVRWVGFCKALVRACGQIIASDRWINGPLAEDKDIELYGFENQGWRRDVAFEYLRFIHENREISSASDMYAETLGQLLEISATRETERYVSELTRVFLAGSHFFDELWSTRTDDDDVKITMDELGVRARVEFELTRHDRELTYREILGYLYMEKNKTNYAELFKELESVVSENGHHAWRYARSYCYLYSDEFTPTYDVEETVSNFLEFLDNRAFMNAD